MPFGDVLNGTGHAQRLALCVMLQFALDGQIAETSIGPITSEHKRSRLLPFPAGRQPALQEWTILMKDQIQQELLGRHEGFRLNPPDAIAFPRPGEPAPGIDIPTAQVRDALGFGQAALFFLKNQLRGFQCGDIHDGSTHDVGSPILGVGEFAASHQPMHTAVGPDHAIRMGVRSMIVAGVVEQGLHFGKIVGMHAAGKSRESTVELAGLESP